MGWIDRWFQPRLKRWTPEWNTSPGCFERHLQRRCGNPLFPMERRSVTPEELLDAKRRDSEELRDFRTQYVELVKECESVPANLTWKETSALLHRIVDLIVTGCGLSPEALPLVQRLSRLYDALVADGVGAVPRSEGDQAKLRRLFGNVVNSTLTYMSTSAIPILAQKGREDSPITDNDFVPALLCESDSDIRGALDALPEVREQIVHEARSLILHAVEDEGYPRPLAHRKMAALGLA